MARVSVEAKMAVGRWGRPARALAARWPPCGSLLSASWTYSGRAGARCSRRKPTVALAALAHVAEPAGVEEGDAAVAERPQVLQRDVVTVARLHHPHGVGGILDPALGAAYDDPSSSPPAHRPLAKRFDAFAAPGADGSRSLDIRVVNPSA
jgi:hypothetical protein